MSGSESITQTYLIDTNVFVSAIKKPKKGRKTLQLILKLIRAENIRIIGNDHLVIELYKYAEEFGLKTSIQIVAELFEKMDIISVGRNYRRICKDYFDTTSKADILHAATCLRADAILITNDKDFDRIRDEGVIKVWSVSKAIERLL
ncbi:MAG: PIN domain-containing protein [Methanomassiliicoccales archaeon]|nr:MAG: PIN domain-containing protein [Methanomassiliicoccales archaeon]